MNDTQIDPRADEEWEMRIADVVPIFTGMREEPWVLPISAYTCSTIYCGQQAVTATNMGTFMETIMHAECRECATNTAQELLNLSIPDRV